MTTTAVLVRVFAAAAALLFFVFIAADPAFGQEAEPPAVQSEEAADAEAEDAAVSEDGEAAVSAEGEDGDVAPDAEGVEGLEGDDAAEDAGLEPEAPSRFQPVLDLIEAGGVVIIILAVLSVISLMLIAVKLVQYTLQRVGDHRFVEGIWAELRAGHPDEALQIVSRRKGVVARVMETALHAKSIDGASEAARQEVERVAKSMLDGLERGLPLLSLVATVSPLLGLLGTVLGMIEAFQQLETAGDTVDPAILSGGIWEALLTTAAGLTVAIPAAAFYTWFQRSVDVAGQHMEDAAVRVFTASLYAPSETGAAEREQA
jgi:biopolymer transport protein ExbB